MQHLARYKDFFTGGATLSGKAVRNCRSENFEAHARVRAPEHPNITEEPVAPWAKISLDQLERGKIAPEVLAQVRRSSQVVRAGCMS